MYTFYLPLTLLGSDFFSRPRKDWHIYQIMTTLIFQSEILYSELALLGSDFFSRPPKYWHIYQIMTTLIFQSEILHSEPTNVVRF